MVFRGCDEQESCKHLVVTIQWGIRKIRVFLILFSVGLEMFAVGDGWNYASHRDSLLKI